jgi:DNA-binding NtrC family response regulator
MANVVLIDDEHGPIDFYVQALTEGEHSVEQLDTVEKLLAHLDKGVAADVYVVDIMMPTHGNPQMRAAADGLASGIVLHKRIRERFPNVPIIMLTSISNPAVIAGLQVESNTRIESKVDTLPSDLVDLVNSVLKK